MRRPRDLTASAIMPAATAEVAHATLGQLEELDVEGILVFAERVLPGAPICGCKRRLNSDSGSDNCSFRTESLWRKRLCSNRRNRTGFQLLADRSRMKMKGWWTRPGSNR